MLAVTITAAALAAPRELLAAGDETHALQSSPPSIVDDWPTVQTMVQLAGRVMTSSIHGVQQYYPLTLARALQAPLLESLREAQASTEGSIAAIYGVLVAAFESDAGGRCRRPPAAPPPVAAPSPPRRPS